MSVLASVFESLSNVFSWSRTKSETSNPTRIQPRRPAQTDFTDSLQCNKALTRGLYHNSYPGMKLAGSMCHTPIAVPVWLMGVPIPKVENNPKIQEELYEIVKNNILNMYQNHKECHIDGTTWIYPFYSTEKMQVVWQFIQDDTITDIIKDIITGEIIKIITDEEITVSTGYDKTASIRRQRIFTRQRIDIKYLSGTSAIPAELKDKSQRNTFGIMPIPFSNNKDSDETRGHSDFERILSDLKNYHDIDLKESKLLSRFDPKMVQDVSDRDQWLENNGYKTPGADDADLSELDIGAIDLIFNVHDREKTEFIFPDRAYEAYEAKLRSIFRKIVEGSGIPEILWGTKVEGNKASADIQMDLVVDLVKDKRRQKDNSYQKLFEDSLKLEMAANMLIGTEYEITIEWDSLDAINEETKSVIFKNFADAISKLTSAAGITKEQEYKLWVDLYPQVTEDKYEDFKKGLTEMARHKQFTDMPFELAADFQGITEIDKDIEITEEEEAGSEEELKNKIKTKNYIQKEIDLIKKSLKEKKNGNGHNKIEQPISINFQKEKKEQPINIDIKQPDIKIPKQPMVINLNEQKKHKKITIIKDKHNNIIGADIEESDA